MVETSIQERIFSRIGSRGIAEAARNCGISESTLRSYKKSVPAADMIPKLANGLGVNILWLLTGDGPESPAKPEISGLPAALIDDFALVQKLELEASAGNGAVAAYDPGAEYIAFQASWLRAHDVNPSAARVLNVHGDSMEPTIRHGDVLLVDTSIDHIKDNAIYVLTWDNSVFVKRVHKRINGSLQLISDNTLYPPEDITKADADQLHIAGRVVWYGRFT
ncbi:MAG: helix-turn-helix transcriptional regulator [Martelella sp.]|uniref:XRE family transcriptional regulator n=1 Tax=Martelella sp. TaxID=1969699 RepID=UPI003242DF61